MEKLFEAIITFDEPEDEYDTHDKWVPECDEDGKNLIGKHLNPYAGKFPSEPYNQQGKLKKVPAILLTIANHPGCTNDELKDDLSQQGYGVGTMYDTMKGLDDWSTYIRKKDGRKFKYYITRRGYTYLKAIGVEVGDVPFATAHTFDDSNNTRFKAINNLHSKRTDSTDDVNFEDD